MKTYAPKGLHGAMLRDLLADLGATPLQVSKYLHVTERSVWRWLKEDNAPYAVLAALWHETPEGRHVTALDVGNELQIYAGLARCHESNAQALYDQLGRVLAISDTGAANDPLVTGPASTFDVNVALQVFQAHPHSGHVRPDGGIQRHRRADDLQQG